MSMQPSRLPEVESAGLILENEAYRQELRRRCQTDPEFLAKVLGYDKLVPRVHGPAFALCARKEPGVPIEQWADLRESLQLDPRGTFKSTLDIVEAVQFIIALPEVRVCVLTATKPTAAAIAGEITDHFVLDKNIPDAERSIFQMLFPEYLIGPRDKRVGEYTAPCRVRNWRESTVMAFSIETAISSWHFDVLIVDDVVETVNSSTPQSTEKVKKNYRINKKTLMPWGFIIYKGTRYGPFELWGDILDKAHPGRIKTLIRGALKRIDGRRIEPGEFPDRSEVELLFPELLSYEFLKQEFEDDYESFMTQFMNDAQGGKEVVFSRESMLAASAPADQVPVTGQMVCAWRLPCASKPNMKHAAGAVGVIEHGRMCVVDVARGKFTPSSLAHKIVQLARKHGSRTVQIEDTPGARYNESAIHNYAAALGWAISIQWLEFQEDDGVRDLRIKSMEPLLPAMRLAFADAIGQSKEMYRQFVNYGMVEENEIPDVVSRLAEALPKSVVVETLDAEQDMAWQLAHQREVFDQMHGLGKYAPPEPMEAPPRPPRSGLAETFGLTDILGGLEG